MNIIYLHGLSSSGNSNTAKKLREFFPMDNVITPDIPVSPVEALPFLHDLVCNLPRHETIIIGTSMGAMYAQQLIGFTRILVNPAFHVSTILRDNEGKTLPFFSKRADGAAEFDVTTRLCEEFEEMERHQFDNCNPKDNVRAFFGDHDETVDCKAEYLEHYSRYEIFSGGHRMNNEVLQTIIRPEVCYLKMIMERRNEMHKNHSESPAAKVKANREDFMKLYVNFQTLRSGLSIKRCNRVFYSDTEREYYDKQMAEDLIRNYKVLFDKYITSIHPELEYLKEVIGPYHLYQILGEPW